MYGGQDTSVSVITTLESHRKGDTSSRGLTFADGVARLSGNEQLELECKIHIHEWRPERGNQMTGNLVLKVKDDWKWKEGL